MNSEEIVETLKAQYPRDVRKQLVKSILGSEKDDDKETMQKQYNILNQIFSFVLKECQWNMPSNSKEWDSKPLEIMGEAFPKLSTTLWYREQENIISHAGVDLVMGEKEKQN